MLKRSQCAGQAPITGLQDAPPFLGLNQMILTGGQVGIRLKIGTHRNFCVAKKIATRHGPTLDA